MWIFFQVLGIICVSIVHMYNRWASINGVGFYTKWLVNILIQFIGAPAFIKSYALAPSFFQPWFLGTALISLTGFLGSWIFFGESISIIKMVGSLLAIIGSILLVL